jgi:hypothetical protein
VASGGQPGTGAPSAGTGTGLGSVAPDTGGTGP